MEYELKFGSSTGNNKDKKGGTRHRRITWAKIFDVEELKRKLKKDEEHEPIAQAEVMCYFKDQDCKITAQKYALQKAIEELSHIDKKTSQKVYTISKEDRFEIWDQFFHHSNAAAKLVGISI